MRIVINGAGIAGPTLAYWLRQAGHEVLLVESAPRLRSGGYVIDFGLAGYDVAEKMGLIPRLRELGYQVKEMRFVDRHGRKRGGIASAFAPKTAFGITFRNLVTRLMRVPFVVDFFFGLEMRDKIKLPDYGF